MNGVLKQNVQSLHEQTDLFGVPTGIRTPVASVKGRCPRPLDDGDLRNLQPMHYTIIKMN